jgi:hypothetical protein
MLILAAVQSRGFVRARSLGSLDDYTIAVSRAIIDEDDDDVVQVRLVQDVSLVSSPGSMYYRP